MSRLLDFRKHSGEASKTHSAPPKTRPCSRFSVFKVLNYVPSLLASPDSPHFSVLQGSARNFSALSCNLKLNLGYCFFCWTGQENPEIINSLTGKDDRGNSSRVSKKSFFERFLRLVQKLSTRTQIDNTTCSRVYAEAKQAVTDYQVLYHKVNCSCGIIWALSSNLILRIASRECSKVFNENSNCFRLIKKKCLLWVEESGDGAVTPTILKNGFIIFDIMRINDIHVRRLG